MRVILHIGLQKTGTTYLQRNVYPRLAAHRVAYNPPQVIDALFKAVESIDNSDEHQRFKDNFGAVVNTFRKEQASAYDTLLICCEALVSHLYRLNYQEHNAIVREVFPDADIVLMLRYQPDWILSAYKQTVQSGTWLGDIEDFVGAFDNKSDPEAHPHQMQVHKLDYAYLCRLYQESHGRDHMHVFFFEDFQKDPQSFLNPVCALAGVPVPEVEQQGGRANRSVSAGMLSLTLWMNRFLPMQAWIHFKPRSSLLARLNWRRLVQAIFDRVWYRDWDLLARQGLRGRLDRHFRVQNHDLSACLPGKKIPHKYMDFVSEGSGT